MTKPFAWSYSALTAFETCPHRFAKTRITKEIIEPQTEATLWGNRVHKAFENNIKSNTPFPDEMKDYVPIADKIRAAGEGKVIASEQKIAITRDLIATKYFASDVWLRAVIDITIENKGRVFVGDYKTGKRTPDSLQLQLSAAVIFAVRPWVETITNTFIWLKDGSTTSEHFERADAPRIWEAFMPRVNRMEKAIKEGTMPKRPSGLCRGWCPVNTCEHWQPKR